MRKALLLVSLLAPTAARAELPAYASSTAPITLDLIAARFAELDGKMNAVRADFRQFTRWEGSDAAAQVEGGVLFRKPDLMRVTHSI